MELTSMPMPSAETAQLQAHILVVEDELLVRLFVSEALRDVGYKVVEAFNGDEAVELLNAGAPVDLILSDVHMPGSCDGLELLTFVKEKHRGIPVVLTSGHLNPTTALESGADQFLGKPYRIDDLIDLIADELAKTQ